MLIAGKMQTLVESISSFCAETFRLGWTERIIQTY